MLRRCVVAWGLGAAVLVGCGGGSGPSVTPDAAGQDGDALAETGDADAGPDLPGDAGGDEGASGPELPWTPPPPEYAVVDEPYLQEFNHTTNEVDPAIGALVSVVLPAPERSDLERPTQVTPRALVRRGAGGAPALVSIPADEPDLVAAVAVGPLVALAGPGAVYRVGAEGAVERFAAPPGLTVRGLAEGGAKALLLTDRGVGTLGAAGEASWPEAGEAVDAALWTDQGLLVARGPVVSLHTPSAEGGPGAVLWKLGPDEGLGVGTVRALVPSVSLPVALDLVVVGDEGLAGVRWAGGNPELVTDDAFADSRVPLGEPRAAVRASDGGFIVATAGGAYRAMDRGDGFEWRVYPAERWLPSGDVRAVATDPGLPDGPVWFATAGGLATVTARRITLEQKLAAFVERVVERHDREGAVADSHLTVRGDLSSNIPWDSDNDGGWTSYWLLGECYRWRVTGAADARANFDRALDGMLRLQTETGTDWFLARSVIRKEGCQLDDCDDPDDGQWFTSPDGVFWVKGDTSNDEVISHLFMMGPAYDLCADEAQRARIRQHVSRIVGGLIDHGYQLVDLDGEVTTYGQFDPAFCNNFLILESDGGRRSLAMLAALELAWYMTGEPRFLEAKAWLMAEQHYADNADGEAGGLFRGGSYSGDNDELSVQSWFTLLRVEHDPELHARWLAGWEKNHANTRLQQAAWWNLAHAALTGEADPEELQAAVRWLRLAPVDLIRWNVRGSHRRDLAPPPAFYAQTGRVRTDGRILPYDERPCERWNTDQFHIDGGADGWTEMDGADVLEPYWMARYFGFIVPASAGTP
ncbi:MAG: hypothetical protein H6744_21595 [Deltaproteobacteria bacterium]|nr:hypothetical protein [Deltaproteobacteria bacterium]